ncbi:MFS transporter [Cellulosimicrobium cellulans]|uniref:MFS transporter n=1 Tax=Cellulosimicrobium cellulans TaxID=1710 RepID=A0A4Y4DZ76_CELCE|nr:MFS transporter [Cellulosimicrobium cellulans]GED10386.1 MFS transporter [Cellulosimicrobium cellulans]
MVQDFPSRADDPENPEHRRDDLTTDGTTSGTPAEAGATPRNPYRAVLTLPGAWRFSAAALVARLPMSMVGIGTILMVQGIYGEYALAGRVAAALVVAQAVVSPQIARLVDRTGQRVVMLPLLAAATLGLGGLILCAVLRAPEWTLYVFAAISGATQGSYGSMVRARWTHIVPDARRLHTAYSLESALDELVFVVGPVLATVLATSVSPSAGLVVPLVAAVVGGLWFLSQRTTEPPVVVPEAGVKQRSAMRSTGMIVLAVIFVAMGIVFGATDVSTIAFAEEQGQKGAAGLILAVFATGSLISGLVYGARHWVSPLWRRFVIGIVALAAGVSLFFFVTSIPVLAAVMFVTGFAIAPTLINGNNLVQNLVAPNQLTEGLAWVGTSLGVGVSIGSSVAGSRIDAGGAHAGFEVVVAAAALAVVLVLVALRSLRRSADREDVTDGTPAH